MKKYITFNNILALIALIIVPLLAVPCFYGYLPQWNNKDCFINFYQRTFGGTYTPKTGSEEGYLEIKEGVTGSRLFDINFNGGLFVTFLFLLLGIIGLVLVNFLKKGKIYAKISGSLFLLTSGILFCCAGPIAMTGNVSFTDRFSITGATIAFGVILILDGSISLISLLFKKKSKPENSNLEVQK